MKIWIEIEAETARKLADGKHVLIESAVIEADREKSVLLGLVGGLRLAGKDVKVEAGEIYVDGELVSPMRCRGILADAEAEMMPTAH